MSLGMEKIIKEIRYLPEYIFIDYYQVLMLNRTKCCY